MKFLYFTDTHIRGNTPVSRTDVFEDTLKRKIEEVHQIGLDESVDFYIHGGDLFDRPDVSVRTVGEFGTLFQKFEKTIFIISGKYHNINQKLLFLILCHSFHKRIYCFFPASYQTKYILFHKKHDFH